MLSMPWRRRSVCAAHSAATSSTSRAAAAMSNQYQPPSMNWLSGSVSSTSPGSPASTRTDWTGWLRPRAVERYTSTVHSPSTLSRSITDSISVQRFQ